MTRSQPPIDHRRLGTVFEARWHVLLQFMTHNILVTPSSNNAAKERIDKAVAYFTQNFGTQRAINNDTPKPCSIFEGYPETKARGNEALGVTAVGATILRQI